MSNSKPTQSELILEYIKQFGSITQLQAIVDLGVIRLPSRVFELRQKGYPIVSERVPVANRYGGKSYINRYSLKEAE